MLQNIAFGEVGTVAANDSYGFSDDDVAFVEEAIVVAFGHKDCGTCVGNIKSFLNVFEGSVLSAVVAVATCIAADIVSHVGCSKSGAHNEGRDGKK